MFIYYWLHTFNLQRYIFIFITSKKIGPFRKNSKNGWLFHLYYHTYDVCVVKQIDQETAKLKLKNVRLIENKLQ